MTTLIRTRIPLETLSMSQQTTGKRRSTRLAKTYDEEDGDFVFARASKRVKTSQAAPESIPAPAPRPKQPSKSNASRAQNVEGTSTVKSTGRRKMSFSTPKQEEKDSVKVAKTRRSTRPSLEKNQKGERSHQQFANGTMDDDRIEVVGTSIVGGEEPLVSRVENSIQPTMISLPFSDTPVINRNKELRKKGGSTRRSSLGMRGRRASSLIDNGHSAIPHHEVETSEFYKHIEADGLGEPRRMKQLLMWNGERALGEKHSHGDPDSAAILAARGIKESLLKDFANKSQFSDWFSREESTIPTKIIKKPNPRNVEIEENLAGLEARIKRLREERDQWRVLAKPQPSIPPIFPKDSQDLRPSHIDASLLDPEQAAILASITFASALDLRKQTSERLRTIQSNLELQVDKFADGVHKVEQYQETIGRVGDKILALSAVRLEERNTREKEAIGTRDMPIQEVLRSLSRILPANSER